jgi:hypothetical protein
MKKTQLSPPGRCLGTPVTGRVGIRRRRHAVTYVIFMGGWSVGV